MYERLGSRRVKEKEKDEAEKLVKVTVARELNSKKKRRKRSK